MKQILIAMSLLLLSILGYGWFVGNEYPVGKKTHENKSESTVIKERKKVSDLQFGDIVFQSSKSGQSAAIQLATNSKYSHVGMLFKEDTEWMVLEAVQPVKLTPLSSWKTHGDDQAYVVKRIKNAEKLLTDEVKREMTSIGDKWIGKNYDIYFDWSDSEIYCSELVWKIYNEVLGIELGNLRPLKEFDLESPIVKQIMRQRYGDTIPMESLMISPGDLFDSEELELVLEEN